MKTSKNYGDGLVSVDVYDINMTEVKQMLDLNDRICEVLINHMQKDEKRVYISDNDLKLMSAILRVFTKDCAIESSSSFNNELKQMDEEEKQMQLDRADDYASREW